MGAANLTRLQVSGIKIVSLLKETPQLRPFAILDEMRRLNPDRELISARRTLERRLQAHRPVFAIGHEEEQSGASGDIAHKMQINISIKSRIFGKVNSQLVESINLCQCLIHLPESSAKGLTTHSLRVSYSRVSAHLRRSSKTRIL